MGNSAVETLISEIESYTYERDSYASHTAKTQQISVNSGLFEY